MGQYEESGQLTGETASAPNQPQPEKEVDALASSKSTRSPAFQFYPKDFLSSGKVERMSVTEIGAYTLLLCRAWLDGDLPDDVAQLARLARMSEKQFTRMWVDGAIKECFVERNGRLVNPRLEKERKAQAEFRKKQKEKADNRWDKHRNATSGNAVALPERHEPGNALQSAICDLRSSSTTPKNGVVARARKAPLHDPSHRKHAFCGRICMPVPLFDEFVRRRNSLNADAEIIDWAIAVDNEWSDGGKFANVEPGEPYAFWKARYAEKWPAPQASKADSRLPAWARPSA